MLLRTIVNLFLLALTAAEANPTSSPTEAPREQSQTDLRALKIESYLRDLEDNNRFMGTVCLTINGDQVANTQVGLAVAKENLRSNSETQYRIASITKMFTAVMVLQLVEGGSLTLDTTLASFFPSIPNAGTITIEHMLHHQSGIKNFTNGQSYDSYRTSPQTQELMILRIQKDEPDFSPGARTEYSNTNYLLLGYIIETVTGNTFDNELMTRIANPIGLTRTAYMTQASAVDNVASSYIWENDDWVRFDETDPTVVGGAGGIMSTASDQTVFIQSLFAGQLLSGPSLATMTQIVNGFGMGIFPLPFESSEGLGHTGSHDGFKSHLVYFPDDEIALAVIGNGFHMTTLEAVTDVLLHITFDEGFQVPRGDENFQIDAVSAATHSVSESIWTMLGIPLAIATLLSFDS